MISQQDDDMRRLRRLQDDPAWIADETSTETKQALRRLQGDPSGPVVTTARLVPILFRTMVTLLTLGLAGAVALGFGVAIPEWTVMAAIAGGTLAMVGVFASLISLGGRTPARR